MQRGAHANGAPGAAHGVLSEVRRLVDDLIDASRDDDAIDAGGL
jgi:hypothetical protein